MDPLGQLKIITMQATRNKGHRLRWHPSRHREGIWFGKCYLCKQTVALDVLKPSITGAALVDVCEGGEGGHTTE